MYYLMKFIKKVAIATFILLYFKKNDIIIL